MVRRGRAAASTSSPAASSSACWPPAATRRRSSSPASARPAPRCARALEAGVLLLQRRERRRTRGAHRSRRSERPARAGEPARQSRRRPQDPSLHLDRPAAATSSASPTPRRSAAYRRAAALAGHRGGRHRLPHRLADHRERALPRRARPRARPGRGARGRRHRRSHHIDFGGGLGITYNDETPPACRCAVRSLLARIDARGHGDRKLLFEPGRSLVGNAGVLVTEVLYLKPGETKNFCIVDAAMNDLLRPAMYRRLDADRRSATRGAGRAADLRRGRPGVRDPATGSAATARWRSQPGDLLAVLSAGAYCDEHGQQLQHPRPRRRGAGQRRPGVAGARAREHRRPDPRRAPAARRLSAPPSRAAREIRPSSTAWQATRTPPSGSSIGRSTRQRSLACGQRGWKVQPAGGCSGLGTSPCTGVRARPLMWMSGIASSSIRVYGWRGAANRSRLVGDLDDAAEVHHADLVGDVADDREVVRDEEVGEALPRLQVLHEVEHLRLHRDVERRGRLVADQELGLGGERARDRDALPLAARELVRKLHGVGGGQPDRAQQLGDALATRRSRRGGLRRSRARAAARRRCPAPSSADSGSRTGPGRSSACRRRSRALGRPSPAASMAVEGDAAARRRVQADEEPRHRALAAARLAHQRQRVAALAIAKPTPSTACTNCRGLRSSDAVEPGRRDVEGLRQALDLDQRRAVGAHGQRSAVAAAARRPPRSQHAARVAPAGRRSGRSTGSGRRHAGSAD